MVVELYGSYMCLFFLKLFSEASNFESVMECTDRTHYCCATEFYALSSGFLEVTRKVKQEILFYGEATPRLPAPVKTRERPHR